MYVFMYGRGVGGIFLNEIFSEKAKHPQIFPRFGGSVGKT